MGSKDIRPYLLRDKLTVEKASIDGGSYGTIHNGMLLGEKVAVKKYNARDGEKDKMIKLFEREVLALIACQTENVVKFLGATLDPMQMVMEYYPDGSLSSCLRNSKLDLKTDEIAAVALKICAGMNHIHTLGYIHRDLKPENVLVDIATKKVCICDFGECRIMAKKMSPNVGTILYLALEVENAENEMQPYDEKADIYNFGYTLFEICNKGVKAQVNDICYDGIDFTFANIIRSCVNRDSSLRPTFESLRKEFEKLVISKPGGWYERSGGSSSSSSKKERAPKVQNSNTKDKKRRN